MGITTPESLMAVFPGEIVWLPSTKFEAGSAVTG